MPNEIVKFLEFLGNSPLWLYFILLVIIFYGIIALLTWSFIKPLKYLGVPSLIGGIILIALRFVITLISINSLIDSILPSLLQPLLTIGVVCTVMGIAMLVGNHVLKKRNKVEKVVVSSNVGEVESSNDEI